MSRVLRRAIRLFIGYFAVLAAVVIAGFLGQAIGLWAAVLWGLSLIAAVAIYARRK
jgi:hypothetical protein